MLMNAIEAAQSALTHPELAGKRVLITGLTSSCGVDLARGFAEHKARLILQFAEEGESMQAVAEIAARSALDIKAFGPVEGDAEAIVTFSRVAVQAFGGLDAVINLVPLTASGLQPGASEVEIERLIAGGGRPMGKGKR